MRVQDLVILMCSGDKHDAEVMKGGEALYVKHVRKHLIGRGKDDRSIRSLGAAQEGLVKARSAEAEVKESALAQRAWLLWMPSGAEVAPEGEFEEGKQWHILAGTDPWPAGKFLPDTGVYVVNHAQGGTMSMFGITFMTRGRSPHSEDAESFQAQSLVRVFMKLGINNCRKVAFASCNLADHTVKQKSFLQEFVIGMHAAGFKTMAAGWDLPFEIVADPSDEAYGRKRGTGTNYAGKFLKALREKNKYVYVYHSADIPFEVKAAQAKVAATVEAAKVKAVKAYMKSHNPLPTSMNEATGDPVEDEKKVRMSLKVNFVDKLKYKQSGWS